MNWCSKIYDIFNGSVEGENELPSLDTARIKRISPNFYQHEIEDANTVVIQNDSPFLEKSDSLTNAHFSNEQLYHNEYSNR